MWHIFEIDIIDKKIFEQSFITVYLLYEIYIIIIVIIIIRILIQG